MLNRLEMLRVFNTVAESHSFKEAATRLAMSPQKITRAIQELEKITGESLFHRNTRSIQITEFGEKFHKQVKDVLNNVDDLFSSEEAVAKTDFAGSVRITVGSYLGRHFLMQILKPLILKYPEIKFDIIATDLISDMVEQKIDIGIRGGVLKDSQLIAKIVGKLDFKVVGSPKLIKEVGAPKTISDLHRVPTTHTINNSTGRPWVWNLNGQDFLPQNCTFSANDQEIELHAALNGVGFSQLGTLMTKPYLEKGKLVEVMSDHMTDEWFLYVVRPHRVAVSKRVRLVFDHLVEHLSKIDFT